MEGSTPQPNLLRRKVRFHCNRGAYRPAENATEGRRRSFRLESLGHTPRSFSLKQFYGPTSEKLVEFGIQPFRGRKRQNPPEEESAAPAEAATTVD
jgi:hypothetical protein